MTTDCPVCDRDDGHVSGCVIGELQALGKEGRQAHRRALVMTLLYTHGRAMTLDELTASARINLLDISEAAKVLMARGLVFPHFGTNPALQLTSAPHVQQECEQAADLLGLELGHTPSPLLRRPA